MLLPPCQGSELELCVVVQNKAYAVIALSAYVLARQEGALIVRRLVYLAPKSILHQNMV